MSYYGNQPPAPYPTNPPPQQGGYPPNTYYQGQQAPPPPYSVQPQVYPNQQPQGMPQSGYPPMPPQPYGGQPMPGQYGFQQPSTVVVQGGFDAGARFDVTGPTLPPPPPGCLPTSAQAAAAHGQNVVVTQRPGNFMTGGSDGGTVIW